MEFETSSTATPASLLERLREPEKNASDWARFVELYSPLLYHWARRLGLSQQDAGDLVQDVFVTLVRKLPDFAYDRNKGFRGWLWTVTLNKFREEHRRRKLPVAKDGEAFIQSQTESDDNRRTVEAEYNQFIAARALKILETDFQPKTWKVFWEHVANSRPAGEVAAEFGVSVGSVYAAKVRVLTRLRQELRGLLEDDAELPTRFE